MTLQTDHIVDSFAGLFTIAQFAVTDRPPLQLLFDTRPVSFVDGVLIVAVGAAFFVVETEKQLRLGWRRARDRRRL